MPIVVTSFREDMSFMEKLAKAHSQTLIVYDKDKVYPNVGRETYTVLHYIIENYDMLPESVIFFQGKLYDRRDHPLLPLDYYFKCKEDELIGQIRLQDQDIDRWRGPEKRRGVLSCKLTCREFCAKYDFSNSLDCYIRCVNFAIGRKIITSKPKSFYEKIFYESNISKHINPTESYLFELTSLNFFMSHLNVVKLMDDNLSVKRCVNKHDQSQCYGYKMASY